MVGSMLELRNYLRGLAAKKVETTLRGIIDRGTNVPAFGDRTDV